ncbi:FAD binding domain-containing protein [Mycena rosella]|uniref:FAD binding domain-containing protein n=1 Tax=Mycena rosella TaxID=1033263 RepID=A0AAD7M7T0_MYCRO|nr:FAD binding domain-containing protein [Mycena rosella]
MPYFHLLTSAALLGAIAQGVSAQNASTCAGVSGACSQLASLYGDSVLSNSSSNYTTVNTQFWDLRSDLAPSCIFLPNTADEVASALGILSSCQAEFAVRGGGHMNFPGSNNIDNGVLLALNNLNNITVNANGNESTFTVGPGNRWFEVYAALEPFGLYAIGGRLKTIGVSGLSLIGGFHYFINKYGFAMDNIVQYDVVLGNGTQVVANNATNPDLFWALKGGANNFGVVTRFTTRAYAIPEISTTMLQFNTSAVEAWVQATVDLANSTPDVAAGAVLTIRYDPATKMATPGVLGVQAGTESPPSCFANFTAIGPTAQIDNVTTPTVWHDQLDSPDQMYRVQFGHHTILPDTTRIFAIYQAWTEAVDNVADVEGLQSTFVLNVMPKSAAAVSKNNGIGNVWGLDDTQNLIAWQTANTWQNASDDLRMTNWITKFLDYHHRINQQMGLASEFLYMGDAAEFQNPFLGMPFENVQRMRAIRAAYDPQGVFTHLNWGGFKLGA